MKNMKKFFIWLMLLSITIFFTGCAIEETIPTEISSSTSSVSDSFTETESETEITTEEQTSPELQTETEPQALTESETFPPSENEPLPASVEKDGSYTSPEDVAEYIHTFGTLPQNFITKKEAQNLGWNSSDGNLQDVAPGMSIGGDKFGNREGILPEGNYHECDVNYQGGYRGAERLVYSDTGEIYYTNDHYQTFTQLY